MEAQSQAANTTVEFIKSVGFTTDKATGVMEPVYVDFQYAKGQVENEKGEKTQTVSNLKVPVLSMVPIPYGADVLRRGGVDDMECDEGGEPCSM